jgi:hypothetical protein
MAAKSVKHAEAAGRASFRTTLLSGGKTATGIEVPDEIVAGFGRGHRPPVLVTINGHTYRSTVAVMGGRHMIGVSAENRTGAGVKAGDEITVDLELDTAPRVVDLPNDLATALDAEPQVRKYFSGLTYSQQQWHVQSIEGAKTDSTRQRRLAKSLEILREGRPR